MGVDFDKEDFRKCLREQFEYILRNESRQLLQESLNETVRERLEELAERELNVMGEECGEDMGDAVKHLAGVQMHISTLDIDHRFLVKQILKKEMKKMLKGFIDENIHL
jgi:DNA-directed RNA polymerase sigma subunit (sigma70/sigma32)